MKTDSIRNDEENGKGWGVEFPRSVCADNERAATEIWKNSFHRRENWPGAEKSRVRNMIKG